MNYEVSVTRDISYSDHERHVFDLYRPDTPSPPPVVVYFHGGGFLQGDKTDGGDARLRPVAERGVAVVAANYRLAPAATFPAQVLDAKAVVAYVRGHGEKWDLDVRKVATWGASAGGYLATMVGLGADVPDEEQQSIGDSKVDAVVSWFAPTDLRAILSRSWLEDMVLPKPPESVMLGLEEVSENPDLVETASPVNHVNGTAPPFLISHGDRDLLVSHHQSVLLHDALIRAGADSTLITLGGAGHEAHRLDQPDHLAMVAAFLQAHLRTSG